MFFPLGALGAFGSNFFPGMEAGMQASDALDTLKGQQAFMKSLSGLSGFPGISPQAPEPGQPSESGANMPTPSAPMAPMQPGMQPPQGGFAGSIPGAQPVPQQPPGVPPMLASADASPGISPHMLAVKGFEGYAPRASWDYKQYSGGYGTRAQPGQTFTPQSADSALQDEWYKAKVAVDNFAPGLPQGPRDALTDLTFNAGSSWMKDRLGQAVKAGDFQTAAQLLQQYSHAGGRQLPGLLARRQEDARWMRGEQPSPQALAAGRMAEARAQGQQPSGADSDIVAQGVRSLQSGGLVSLQQMAHLVERANPDASPNVKFKALQAGMKLMNSAGQQQFSQLMQIMQYQQRERMHQDTLTKQGQMEEHRLKTEELRERNYLRRDPYYQREADAAKTAQKNLTNNELRTEKVKGHIDALAELVKKVQITGNVRLDTWLQEAARAAGWPQDKYFQYLKQLQDLQSEIGAMSQQTLGSLTVSAREDAKQFASGILTPTMLKSLGEAVKIDSKITREASKKLIAKHQRNMDEFMRTGTPPDEEDEEEPTTGAGAPAATPGGGGGLPPGVTITPMH